MTGAVNIMLSARPGQHIFRPFCRVSLPFSFLLARCPPPADIQRAPRWLRSVLSEVRKRALNLSLTSPDFSASRPFLHPSQLLIVFNKEARDAPRTNNFLEVVSPRSRLKSIARGTTAIGIAAETRARTGAGCRFLWMGVKRRRQHAREENAVDLEAPRFFFSSTRREDDTRDKARWFYNISVI